MGRRRRQAAQRRQPLLPGQHRLGGGQRQLHPGSLRRGLPGVGGGEQDSDHLPGQQAGPVEVRQHQGLAVAPGQRGGEEVQGDRGDQRQKAETGGVALAQGGRGDHDRRDQQERERIGEAAGQAEQDRQLQEIEAELHHRLAPAGQPRSRPGQGHRQVRPGADEDHRQARHQGQVEAEPEVDEQHGGELGRQRHPAQHHQRAEPQPAPRLGPVADPTLARAALPAPVPGPIPPPGGARARRAAEGRLLVGAGDRVGQGHGMSR